MNLVHETSWSRCARFIWTELVFPNFGFFVAFDSSLDSLPVFLPLIRRKVLLLCCAFACSHLALPRIWVSRTSVGQHEKEVHDRGMRAHTITTRAQFHVVMTRHMSDMQ